MVSNADFVVDEIQVYIYVALFRFAKFDVW